MAEADRESTWPALREDVVEPKSSPVASVRPPAPEISFGAAPALAAIEATPAETPPSDAARDDVSVPPVDVDQVDHRFFDADAHAADASDFDGRDARAALKRSPAMARRRAHLARYVTATMGLATALLVAAIVKGAMAGPSAAKADDPGAGSSGTAHAAAVNTDPTTAQAPSPSTTAALAAPAESTASPQAQGAMAPPAIDTAAQAEQAASAAAAAAAGGPATEPVAAADPPKPSDPVAAAPEQPAAATTNSASNEPMVAHEVSPPVQAAAAPAPSAQATTAAPVQATTATVAGATNATGATTATVTSAGSAAREKEHARSALERSSLFESISAGERSVTLDPTDAEAWLILGAAYQQKGDTKNAARCFKACTDRSTHGPRGECAAMLH